MVDTVILVIILFFVFAGLRKGFCQYLLELLITAISLGISWFYYQQRQEVLKSLLVFILVFLSLSLLKWFLLRVRRKRAAQKLTFSFANRFWGSILSLTWGIFITSALILTLDLFPAEAVFSYNIKQDLRGSHICQIVQRLVPIKRLTIIENISYMSKVGLDEEAKMKLLEQPEFKELLKHESLKAIMEDAELVKQLQNKDLPNLLTNPKILKLLNDGQFIEKLMELDFKKAAE